jgi:hypothetical protein
LAAYPAVGEVPVPGARVMVSSPEGPLETLSDEEGRFVLSGVPADAAVVISAPGYVSSMVAGWSNEPLTVHLVASEAPRQKSESYIPVSGFVMSDAVTPVPGAIVFGGNGRGTTFGPFTTDDDGRFEGFALSTDGVSVSDVAVWAYMQKPGEPPTALGLKTGMTAAAGAAPFIVTLVPPAGEFRLAALGPAGNAAASVTARAPNGLEATLAIWYGLDTLAAFPYFEMPDLTLMGNVSIDAGDGLAQSTWQGAVTGPGRVDAQLLPFPGLPSLPPGGPAEGQVMTWPVAAGASGYRVALRDPENGAPLWEAYTPQPRLTFQGLPAGAPGALEIIALGGQRSDLRQVASVPSCLRWIEASDGPERFATRHIKFSGPSPVIAGGSPE